MSLSSGEDRLDKIGLITDSTCDIPDDFLEKYQVEVLPTRIIYKDREYRDKVDISAKEIYDNFDVEIPKTSMPSPDDFFATVEKLKSKGIKKILCVFVSSGLSGTYNSFKVLSEDIEDVEVSFLDSKALSLGLGFVVMELAKAIESGMGFEELVKKGKELIDSTKVFFIVKTLHYLREGGRIGFVEGTIGDLLHIKPIITIDHADGKYRTYKKVRGEKKALASMRKIVDEYAKNPIKVAIMHGKYKEESLSLLEYIKNIANVKEVHSGQISPVLSVHTGPGLIGVIIQE